MSRKPKPNFENQTRKFMAEMQSGIPDARRRARLAWSETLVLNADYRPVSVLPLQTLNWMDAIFGIIKKKYRVEIVHEDIVVRSPSVEFHVPSVVINDVYIRHRRKVEFTDVNVFLRDGYKCQYCGDKFAPVNLTYDHLVPRARGGKTDWANIVTACSRCNSLKGKKLITEWKTPRGTHGPINRPIKPDYEMLEARVREQKLVIPDHRWADYLGWSGPLFVNDGVNAPYQVGGQECEVPPDVVGF